MNRQQKKNVLLKKRVIFADLFLVFMVGVCLEPSSAWSGQKAESAVVRVFSGICEGDREKFRGSGLLLQNDGKIYVLTSEHVVLHSNHEFCHYVWNRNLGRVETSLLQADWGMGLALLEISEKINPAVPELAFLIEMPVERDEAVMTLGFPCDSDEMVADDKGRVLIAQSPRHLIPLVPTMVETLGSHGEFGMSGGPVTSADGNRFIGILSHQYLSIVPGRSSVVREFDSEGVESDHLFVIPVSVAGTWAKRVIEGKETAHPSFVRDALAQLEGKEIVISTGIRFGLEIQGKADGKPVGGGDGVGSGGAQGKVISAGVPGLVRVGLEVNEHAAIWNFPGLENWVGHLKDRLLRRASVEIPFFVEGDTESGGFKKVSFHSLSQFVRYLSNPNYKPVTVIKSDVSLGSDRYETCIKDLRETGEWVATTVTGLQKRISLRDSLGATELLSKLALLGELLQKDNWQLVDLPWVKHLEEGYGKGWRYLLNNHYDEGVELLKRIFRIEQTLSKVKL